MKKMAYRILAAALVLSLMLVPLLSHADSGEWTCENCGLTGNNGNFCPECGAERPSTGWTCPNCGQKENTGNFCSECGTAKPEAGTQPPQQVNEWLEQIPGETNRVKVCLTGVEASEYIKPKDNPTKWQPDNAVDGNETTCWQVSSKRGFKKGRIWFRLNTGMEQTVDSIWFKNGFWAYNTGGDSQYTLNARPSEITVSFLYNGEDEFRDEVRLTLKDEAFTDWQRWDEIGHHEQVAAVKITVNSSYPGTDFENDVCLSEVMLVQNAPAATAKEAAGPQEAVVYKKDPAITGAGLLDKLSTRSGPGTEYDEPGTFFGKNWKQQNVKVLGKHYDGSVWWVLVDFSNGGKKYRVWTGLKRVDVDVNDVRDYYPKGEGTVNSTSDTYRGPGGKYAKAKVKISGWKDVVAYGRENGYVEVEFEQGSKVYRLWVPESVTSIDWGTDKSGGS